MKIARAARPTLVAKSIIFYLAPCAVHTLLNYFGHNNYLGVTPVLRTTSNLKSELRKIDRVWDRIKENAIKKFLIYIIVVKIIITSQ